MLTRKNVAIVAIVAIALAVGAAGIVITIGQEAYAQVVRIKPPCNDDRPQNDNACRAHGPPPKPR
jgi:hypothetical protein